MTLYWFVAAVALIGAAYGIAHLVRTFVLPRPFRIVPRDSSDAHLEKVHDNVVYYGPAFSSTRNVMTAHHCVAGQVHDITDLATAYDGPNGGGLDGGNHRLGRLASLPAFTVHYTDNETALYRKTTSGYESE